MTYRSKLLIALAFVTLGAVACGNVFQAGAAVVNGVSISQEDLDERLAAAAGQGGAAPGDPAAARQALTQLIQEALLTEEAERRDLDVGEDGVEEQITQIRSQFPDDASYQAALEENGFTEASLRAAIRDQLLREELTAALAGEVSEAEIREVYEMEVDRFTQIRARHILLRVEDPSEDERVRARADRALARLRDGEPFPRLARSLSQDEGSAARGGDLGFFSLADLVPEFAQAAKGGEIGELVGPVRTQFGYHIILVLARKITPFEEARAEVQEQLESQLGQRALQEFLAEAIATARISINPRYGDWDPESQQIVPHESFVPPSAEPDPNAPADAGAIPFDVGG